MVPLRLGMTISPLLLGVWLHVGVGYILEILM